LCGGELVVCTCGVDWVGSGLRLGQPYAASPVAAWCILYQENSQNKTAVRARGACTGDDLLGRKCFGVV
jgi:hypothetical protein